MTKWFTRETTYPIQSLLISRVSYRSFSDEAVPEEELLSLFEAARWAPSSYNNQPWRYVYARRGEKGWDALFGSLIDWNKRWCHKADTLVLVTCKNNFERNNKPSITAQFDTGASWMSLALEAHARGLIAHGMQGFDYHAVKTHFSIPDSFTILAMVALGKPGSPDLLPPDIKKEEIPSNRKPLTEIVARGEFSFS